MKTLRKHLKRIALLLSVAFLMQSCEGYTVIEECDKCVQYTYKHVEGVGTVLDENLGEVEMAYCDGLIENPNPELYIFQLECYPVIGQY